ncbi:MAG: type II secretion system protein GspC [Sinobacterium sp.]|nr:type II secretion system protein GspC [Sinobacterium sp.]
MSSSNAIWATLISVPLFAALLERLRQIPMSKLRTGLLLAIVVWFLLILADIVWMVVPQVELRPLEPVGMVTTTNSKSGQSSSRQVTVNVNTMKQWMLFGSFQEEAVETVAAMPSDVDLDAKETRLSLQLLGIMQSSNPNRGHAIIKYQSTSELYAVGDAIPISRGVTLSKVLAERVIIDNNGSFESLFLWDESAQKVVRPGPKTSAVKKPKSNNNAQRLDKRHDANLTKLASGYKQKLLNDPMSMADVMRISPSKNADGGLQGYRISPGRDRKNFKAFGLKSGDIITAVNGIELNDQANAMRVYQDLSSATEASFDILRGGDAINLMISLE